jgi:hypothetical protein
MVSAKHRNTFLYVRALDGKDVREIDEFGKPLMALRVVGKENGVVISSGVKLPYHSHYIAKLKEGMLLPEDSETAKLAGVPFQRIST